MMFDFLWIGFGMTTQKSPACMAGLGGVDDAF
jgi:hypothetical protein